MRTRRVRINPEVRNCAVQPRLQPRLFEHTPATLEYRGSGYMTPQEEFRMRRPRNKPYRGGGSASLPPELRGGGFADFLDKLGSGITSGLNWLSNNAGTISQVVNTGKNVYNTLKGGGVDMDMYPDYGRPRTSRLIRAYRR